MKRIWFVFVLLMLSNVSFASVAPDVRISDNSGNVLNINSDGTLPVSGAGGAGGVLETTTVYGEGRKTSQLLNQNSGTCITYNGNQYCGLWDQNTRLVLCKRTVDAASWSCINYNGFPQTPTFTGAGLNDMVQGGTATSGITATSTYDVEIDATGTPDTFKWRLNGGSYTTGVAITAAAQTLSNGVQITFNATTGHTVGNSWSFRVHPAISVNGDVHQGVGIGVDSTGILHFNLGSYVTEGGLHYRRSQSAESVDGITAEQSISTTSTDCKSNGTGASQVCDTQASYVTFFNDNNGALYTYFRSNGGSGAAETFLWKYNTGSSTWAAATGTDSTAGHIGAFIDARSDSRSAYISHPFVDSNNKAHFVWSWRDNNATPQFERGISTVVYDCTNGDFEKTDGSAQTIPVRYSNDDSIDSSGEDGLDYNLEGMQYRSPLAVDSSGNTHVVYTKAKGAGKSITHTVGTGLSDITTGGVATGFTSQPTYQVVITSAANPDVFKWRVNGGSYTTGVTITGKEQTLSNGVTITFAASTGHTANDAWEIKPTTGYLQTYHIKHNGTSWGTAEQITNTSDVAPNFPDHRGQLLYENGKFYVLYISYTDGTGINVIETSDWVTLKKYSITNNNMGTYSPGYSLLAFDRMAWKTYKNFYTPYSYNWDFQTYSYSRSPVYMLKWDPSSGAGVRQQQSYGLMTHDDLTLGSVDGFVRLWGPIRLDAQNIFYLRPASDDIEAYTTSTASDGDVINLGAGTFTIYDDIDVTRQVTIRGQGGYSQGCKTTIASTMASINVFDIAANNVRIEDLCITSSGATSKGIQAVKATSGLYTGLFFKDVGITMTGTGTKVAMQLNNVTGEAENLYISSTSSDNSARGLYYYNTSNANAAATFTCKDCYSITSGAATNSKPYEATDSSATQDGTLTLRNCVGIATESGTTTSYGAGASGDSNGKLIIEGGWYSGADNDLNNGGSGSVLTVKTAHLANKTYTGTITYSGGNVGPLMPSVASGANTACSTTCGTKNCLAGWDTASTAPLACSDATADSCLCNG